VRHAVSAAYHDCLKIIWCRIASGQDTFPVRFAFSTLWWCRIHTKLSLLVIQHALSSSQGPLAVATTAASTVRQTSDTHINT
jgi:hypothetical protein